MTKINHIEAKQVTKLKGNSGKKLSPHIKLMDLISSTKFETKFEVELRKNEFEL